jgi:hypothetical protein
MDFEDIRVELLAQHERLRRLIHEARDSAIARAVRSRDTDLRALVDRLGDHLREHNVREEELLAVVLPTMDAWGTVRQEIMTESHVLEHGELLGALEGMRSSLGSGPCGALLATLDRILEHMVREEKILNDPLLRPDGMYAEQESG